MMTEHIAVGILINSDNKILIAKRPADKHMGGKWEFPGGKVEDGETSKEALYREIHEEIGVVIQSAERLTEIIYNYDDKRVILDFYKVIKWTGEAQGMEQQPLIWVKKHELSNYEFPEANVEIISLLQ